MPAIMTLEGPNLNGGLGWMRPDDRLGAPGRPSPGCINCTPLSDWASDFVSGLTTAAADAAQVAALVPQLPAIAAYQKSIDQAKTASMYIGIFGGILGLIAGALVGRRMDTKGSSIPTLIGAAVGGLGVGFGGYFVGKQALSPGPYVPPPNPATQTALNILNQP